MIRRQLRFTLFPYTTLFRSVMPPLGKGTLGTWRFHQCSAVPDTEPEHHRGLVQFCTLSTVCKRCQKPLGIRYATLILSHNRRDEENCPEERSEEHTSELQ